MADGVDITPGTGAKILTDDTGAGGHAQVMKLAISTDGSATLIPADGTNGLAVDVTRVSGTVTVGATNLDIRDLNSASDSVAVVATNLDIRDLASGTDSVTAVLSAETTKIIGTVNVAAAQTIAVTNAGTFAAQIDGAALTSLQLNDDPVFADEASFTVGSSKVKVAGFLADDASPDVAAEGQAVAARTTLDRKQIVMLGESGANFVRGGGSKTDTSDQSIMAASGSASIYNYLCWVAVYNASATNTYVNVKDGSTVVAVLPLPAYGGAVFNLPHPIRGSGNTAFNLATGAGVTTAYLYGGGYKGA